MEILRAGTDRTIVKSRGIKEEMECGLIIPSQFLRWSNVCTTRDGRTAIIRDHSNKDLPTGEWVVRDDDIIAEIKDGKIIPSKGWIHTRKCSDPEQDIITSLSGRKNQFAEILAVGAGSELDSAYTGWLAYVKEDALSIQAVEDGYDEWMILLEEVLFVTEA